jgi:hypothetical protein
MLQHRRNIYPALKVVNPFRSKYFPKFSQFCSLFFITLCGAAKKYDFSPQGFTASRWSKINFGIFGKSFSNQILVEQGKVQLLLEKPCHFSEKKSQK